MPFKKRLSDTLKRSLDHFIINHYEPPFDAAAAEDSLDGFRLCAPERSSAPLRKKTGDRKCAPCPEVRYPEESLPYFGAEDKAAVPAERKEHPVRSASVPVEPRYSSVGLSQPTAVLPGLDRELSMLDESFRQMLLRKIDEKDMKDSACYKRAGVDRKLFSKIRSNPDYRPKKATAIAFCIALELPFDEAMEMLRKAGYTLSRSSKFDVIVEYFIRNRRYDLNELNIALYEYDQPIIG